MFNCESKMFKEIRDLLVNKGFNVNFEAEYCIDSSKVPIDSADLSESRKSLGFSANYGSSLNYALKKIPIKRFLNVFYMGSNDLPDFGEICFSYKEKTYYFEDSEDETDPIFSGLEEITKKYKYQKIAKKRII